MLISLVPPAVDNLGDIRIVIEALEALIGCIELTVVFGLGGRFGEGVEGIEGGPVVGSCSGLGAEVEEEVARRSFGFVNYKIVEFIVLWCAQVLVFFKFV